MALAGAVRLFHEPLGTTTVALAGGALLVAVVAGLVGVRPELVSRGLGTAPRRVDGLALVALGVGWAVGPLVAVLGGTGDIGDALFLLGAVLSGAMGLQVARGADGWTVGTTDRTPNAD